MQSINRILLFILVYAGFCQQTFAQVNTLYFMENTPSRSTLNPGFIPTQKLYIELPGFYTGVSNNSFGANDLFKRVDGSTVSVFENNTDYTSFLNALKSTTNMTQDTRVNLIGFGIRDQHNYYSFGLSQRAESNVNVPKDLLTILLEGVPLTTIKNYNLSSLSGDASSYLEAAFGYARQVTCRLSAGGKIKLLFGQNHGEMSFTQLSLSGNQTTTSLIGSGTMRFSLPIDIPVASDGAPNFSNVDYKFNMMKFTGMGVALDAGMAYKLLDNLTLSAAITDFGFIHWKKSNFEASLKTNTTINNMSFNVNDGSTDATQITDSLRKAMSYVPNGAGYSSSLAAHVKIGAEYSILNNAIGFGLLYDNRIKNTVSISSLTASANFRPAYWINTSVSYALIDNKASAIGFGLNLIAGPVNIFFASDYIPTSYGEGKIPKKLKEVNGQVGIALTFGHITRKTTVNNFEFPAGTPDLPE